MRAREPDRSGYAERSGVRLYWDVFGEGPTTVLLLPSWAIVHSRMWKLQVPYLARHFRVITYDPRGNGCSTRPVGPAAYTDAELVADALAVLDATDTDSAVCVGLSQGARVLLELAAVAPVRVSGAVLVGTSVQVTEPRRPRSGVLPFERELDSDEGWATYNARYWQRDLRGFARFFFGESFVERYSSKQIEDAVGWAMETDAGTLIATERGYHVGHPPGAGRPSLAAVTGRVRCPCLVVHGDDDRIVGADVGPALADALGCRLELIRGGGHCVPARHPVRFNLVVRQFVESVAREA